MNKQSDQDQTIDAWLRKQSLEPRHRFAEESYAHALNESSTNISQTRKMIAFPLQLAAAAAIVIAILTTMSVWQNDTDNTNNSVYSNLDYIEMEELLLLEDMLEPLAAAGDEVYPEYYW